MNMKNMTKIFVAAALAVSACSVFASSKKTLTYGDDEVLEPEDSLMFMVDEDQFSTIAGNEVLTEYLPDGIDVEWTGKKFKTPKSASPKVKKIDGEYEIVVSEKGEDNPCSLKVKYNKKKGTVSGSFKVFTSYETKKGKLKLKKYTAKFSGKLGEELTCTIKKVGSFTATMD